MGSTIPAPCYLCFGWEPGGSKGRFPNWGWAICYQCLEWGSDGRLYGLTRECVFSADRDLSEVVREADYLNHAAGNFYRFGMPRGPDGHFYFANGPRLMRFRL